MKGNESKLKRILNSEEPLSMELVKEINRVLTAGTYDEHRYVTNQERPGEFKKHDYVTGIYQVGSPAEQVERDMDDLITEVNAYKHPPLIIYDEDKRLYYECLQKYDETEELIPLYRFLRYEAEKTWEKALEPAKGIKEKRKGLRDFDRD